MEKDKKDKKKLKCYTKKAPISGKIYTTCNADAQQEKPKKKKKKLVLKVRPKERLKPVIDRELPDDVLKLISDYSKPIPQEKYFWADLKKAQRTKLLNRIASTPIIKAMFKELFDLKTKIVDLGGSVGNNNLPPDWDDDDFDVKKEKRTLAEFKKTWRSDAFDTMDRSRLRNSDATLNDYIKYFATADNLFGSNNIKNHIIDYKKRYSRLNDDLAKKKKDAPRIAALQLEADKPLSLKYKFAFKFYGLYPKGVEGDDDRIINYLWKEYQKDRRYISWLKTIKTTAKKLDYDTGKSHFIEMFLAAKRHIRNKDIEAFMTIEKALDYIFSEQSAQSMFMARQSQNI